MYTLNTIRELYDKQGFLPILPFFTPYGENGYLSNWYNSEFKDSSYSYKTNEHYMMAQKALLFNDTKSLKDILFSTTPKEAKALGRGVKNFNNAIWLDHRIQIMLDGLILKFNQNPKLKASLLKTKPLLLVEASPYDAIWGVKLSKDDVSINNPHNWKGENLLGFCLTHVRDSY